MSPCFELAFSRSFKELGVGLNNGKMNSRVKKIPFTFTREGKIQIPGHIPGQIRMKIDAFAMNVNSRSKRKKNENLKKIYSKYLPILNLLI